MAITTIAGCTNAPTPAISTYRGQGYLQDTAGNSTVIKSLGYDACIRTSDWTPARATVDCDPDLVPKLATQAPAAPAVARPSPPSPPPPALEAKIAPAPALALATPPAPQRFTLSADALFDFGKSAISRHGRRKLDAVADALKGTQQDTIIATGHTDRIGNAHDNQRLSEQRAMAVKSYLQSKGIDVGKMTTLGKGNTQPITKPGDCPQGKLSRAALFELFSCLQPDRRVDIEVSGGQIIDPNAAAVARPHEPPAQAASAKAKGLVKSTAKPRSQAKILIGQ